jgi:zinc protease
LKIAFVKITDLSLDAGARPRRHSSMILGANMRRFFLACVSVFAVLGAQPALAQLAPQPSFPQDRYKDFAPDPAIKYGTLPNGMRYAIQRWPTPRGEASIRLRIAAGSYMESDAQSGLMHFMEHMAFNGSENVPESEFDKMMSREGLAFGPDTNAYTSWDETVYQLDMPNAAKVTIGLNLMRETAGRLLLDDGAIDRERGIIASEERSRDNPGFRVFKAFAGQALAGTQAIPRLPIGDMKVVREAKRDRFLDLYKRYYTPQRALLVVVGDFEPAAIEAEITRIFSDWVQPSDAGADPSLGTLQINPGSVKLLIEPQAPSNVQLFNVKPIRVNVPDTTAENRKGLLLDLAETIISQRLEKIARREGSPITSASFGSEEYFQVAEVASISAAPKDPTKWREALNIVDLELRRALTHGFTKVEFDAALADLKQGYADAAAQVGARRSAEIVDTILSEFADDSVLTTDVADVVWLNSIVASLTPEAALAELKESWGTTTPQMFVNSGAAIEGGEDALRAAYEAARARPVPPPAAERVQAWPYTNFGATGRVATTQNLTAIGVTQSRFANNVRLVVKPTKFEEGRIRVQVRFGEGNLAIPGGNGGTSFVLSTAFTPGGLGRMDVDAINRAFAGRTVQAGFGLAEDAFVLSGTTTPRDLELQLQYLAAYLTDPAWRPDGLARLKSSKDAIYRSIDSTPGSVWSVKGGAVLRSDPRAPQFPTPTQFDALTLAQARSVLDPARRNGAIEVTIVGDTSLTAATRAVAKTFGALPARPMQPLRRAEARVATFPAGRGTTVLQHKGRADQSLAMIYWPMRDYGDGREARALRVLESVLQNRLTEVIREELGDSYSPSSTWQPSDALTGYGVIGAISEVKPEKDDLVIAAMERIAADLAAGKIDADLFERAKRPLVADFDETTANNPWWLGALSNISFDPNRLTRVRDAKSHYASVTLDQVKALARQYLAPSKARIVKVVPGPEATPVPATP